MSWVKVVLTVLMEWGSRQTILHAGKNWFFLTSTPWRLICKKKREIKWMFPPGIEPGTFRVLGERDNRYTMETTDTTLGWVLTLENKSTFDWSDPVALDPAWAGRAARVARSQLNGRGPSKVSASHSLPWKNGGLAVSSSSQRHERHVAAI